MATIPETDCSWQTPNSRERLLNSRHGSPKSSSRLSVSELAWAPDCLCCYPLTHLCLLFRHLLFFVFGLADFLNSHLGSFGMAGTPQRDFSWQAPNLRERLLNSRDGCFIQDVELPVETAGPPRWIIRTPGMDDSTPGLDPFLVFCLFVYLELRSSSNI